MDCKTWYFHHPESECVWVEHDQNRAKRWRDAIEVSEIDRKTYLELKKEYKNANNSK